MRTAIAYCYPTINSVLYDNAARRFAMTYQQFPPGATPHQVVVVGNGPAMGPRHQKMLAGLPYTAMQHDNTAKDIGAFQKAAATLACDLLVCFGAHVHFWRPGWLDRMVDAYVRNGPGLYGCWGFFEPLPHIRTTAFWCPPQLLNEYPYYVANQTRYPFEHGPNSLTLWARKMGFETPQVTWTRVLDASHWDCLGREECLCLDQHSERAGIG